LPKSNQICPNLILFAQILPYFYPNNVVKPFPKFIQFYPKKSLPGNAAASTAIASTLYVILVTRNVADAHK